MTLRRVTAALAAAVFLSACAATPPTPSTIQGKYELRGKGIYAGESFEIHGDSFAYSRFSDALSDPSIRGMPVVGGYTLKGTTIIFHHPRVPDQQRSLEQHFGRFSLWTPRQLAERAETGRTPHDVLYQVR